MGTTTVNGPFKKMSKLDQAVIELHDIARQVEEAFGICKLSMEMRKVADELAESINKTPKSSKTKGNQ